ncbi:hypothetical protein A5821_000874 [Enterococcus sp. 7F3_DIV0205]|uniref:Uncharacterized protein n=1 Tax=Candidatus Enterococcus palustris TaxID=1834189 RepID=A0AAQ3WAP5_9ENTE|nr:hypothetical protein [Enterococcus sp. 7F3_DIV0205]OTN85289.1 hypothetical protein A5821_001218 [Enterococcus sp. 7F3_DIV0205]
MEQHLIKIRTTFHNTWLINLKKDSFSEENNILFGDTVRLSISKNDSYYFSEAIALTYDKEILSREQPTTTEIDFFNYMKVVQERMFSKALATKYGIEHYIIPTAPIDDLEKDS